MKFEDSDTKQEALSYQDLKDFLQQVYEDGVDFDIPELDFFHRVDINRETISNFCHALVDFIRSEENPVSENDSLYNFAQYISEKYFSFSPNLANMVSLSDRLALTAKATRSEIIQSTFGHNFVGEMVYDISFMNGDFVSVVERSLAGTTIPEQLDTLHQLRTVGAQAIANGSWSRPAYEKVIQAYTSISKDEKYSIFVRIAAESGIEVLDQEYDNPQLSFVRREGQTSDSRLHDRSVDEKKKMYTYEFFSSYQVDVLLSSATKVVPAAKDALLLLDETGLATGVINCDTNTLSANEAKKLPFDINQYRILRDNLSSEQHLQVEDRSTIRAFHYLYRDRVQTLLAQKDAVGAAKVFAHMLPLLSEEEWLRFFEGEIVVQEVTPLSERLEQAATKNGELANTFMHWLIGMRDTARNPHVHLLFTQLEQILDEGDLEHAFEVATKIVDSCDNLSCFVSEKVEDEINKRFDLLRNQQTENFDEAKDIYNKDIRAIKLCDEVIQREIVVDKIEDNLAVLREQILNFLDKEISLATELPQLHAQTLIEVIKSKITTLSDEKAEELELLFGHVHSGEMATKIESSFGFSLNGLTIREQMYFLDYLKYTTVGEVEVMKAFVQHYGVTGMRTFLALEQGGEDLGDKIVAFGASIEPDIASKVFAGYSDLLDQLSEIDTFLNEEFAGDKETKEQLAVLAKEKLQKHAADFLVNQLQRTDVISATESAEIVVEVEKAAGLASAISSALRARKVTSVDTFQSFRQDIVSGKEILNSPLFGEMLKIYRRNYTDKYEYTEEGRQVLLNSFTEKLQKETTQVYVWRIGDSDVLTFLYADEYPDQSAVYIGGLNSNPTFNDTKAGKGLIENMLRDYDTKQFVITAEAAPQNAAAYMTLYDFVGYKRTDDADEPFVLAVARHSDWDFKSKKTPRNEVLKQLETNDVYTSPDTTIMYVKGESSSTVVDSFLDKGYVVTKLFAGNKSDDTATNYFVLEYAPFVYASLSPRDSEIKSAA